MNVVKPKTNAPERLKLLSQMVDYDFERVIQCRIIANIIFMFYVKFESFHFSVIKTAHVASESL